MVHARDFRRLQEVDGRKICNTLISRRRGAERAREVTSRPECSPENVSQPPLGACANCMRKLSKENDSEGVAHLPAVWVPMERNCIQTMELPQMLPAQHACKSSTPRNNLWQSLADGAKLTSRSPRIATSPYHPTSLARCHLQPQSSCLCASARRWYHLA